jgi:hypothetical protein
MIKNLEAGNIVQPFYVNTLIDDGQHKHEKDALCTILDFLSTKFTYQQLLSLHQVEHVTSNASEFALNQPPIWIWEAHRYIHNKEGHCQYHKIDHFDEIQIAYVMEDHAVSFLSEIKQLYSVLNKFVFKKDDTYFPILKFPIIKLNKSVIFDYIACSYPEIFEVIWFCEQPHGEKRCGHCHSCKVAQSWDYDMYLKNAQRILSNRGAATFSSRSQIKRAYTEAEEEGIAQALAEIGKHEEDNEDCPVSCDSVLTV